MYMNALLKYQQKSQGGLLLYVHAAVMHFANSTDHSALIYRDGGTTSRIFWGARLVLNNFRTSGKRLHPLTTVWCLCGKYPIIKSYTNGIALTF